MYKNARHRHSHSDYDLQADLQKIRNAFVDTASDLRGRTGEFLANSVENVKDRSNELRDQLSDYASEKPIKTLGIAFLAGVVLGYLLHHK